MIATGILRGGLELEVTRIFGRTADVMLEDYEVAVDVLWQPAGSARDPRPGDVVAIRICCGQMFAIPPAHEAA